MRNNLFVGVALSALMLPGAAFAQSTGSVDFDQGDIVVTAARASTGVGGVQIPDSSKAKGVLTQEFIAKQTPGNSILDTINSLPGVSFQNNDPFGSAGGTLSIRGFDASRIALTFDGVPLNDTGNYALYSNQQLDPELIEQVNVSYGSTDVDSPTAAASGSTVNYRTIVPTDKFGARLEGSVGDYNFFRVFGIVNTGEFTHWGTKAWISASHAENDVVFNDFGKIRKAQYNARVYQPIGSNGDFISISGNYNVNRNNFFGSAPLRYDTTILNAAGVVTGTRTPGTGSSNRFPFNRDELPYSVPRCQINTVARTGLADNPNSCGTTFDERYNPSNTGNIRVSSRFTLAPGLILTVEPSFQYVKANGGGTVTLKEATKTVGSVAYQGFVGGSYYAGRDLNGDGDLLDGVIELAPSQTVTHRYGLISSLRYDINDDNSIRIAYSHDYGRHRQTGELAPLQLNGFPTDVFPINNPVLSANGRIIEKRDRLSFAVLDQVSGEYRGTFGGLTVNLGVRAPFFKRNLNNFCFTTSASGFVDCLGRGNTADNSTYAAAAANATFAAPQTRQFTYNRVLPNVGATYKFADHFTAYINYSKGLQVPGTDNLYQSFFYPLSNPAAHPVPETTDNFDGGLRYTSSKIQATISPWFTRFTNRLASAYDVTTDQTIYRNLGRVDKYGIDGSFSYRPIREVTMYIFGSYLKSEIKNNVELGKCTVAAGVCTAADVTAKTPIYALTAGKRESGAPVYTFGGRLQGDLGPVELAIQAKRTGSRYLNDQNLPNLQCTSALVNQACPTTAVVYQVYPAKTPAYTQVDLDARLKMSWAGLNDTTYLQLNVQNLFNTYYVGGFTGGSTTQFNVPFVQIGSPRAFIATLNAQF